jgi:hypothetical protein
MWLMLALRSRAVTGDALALDRWMAAAAPRLVILIAALAAASAVAFQTFSASGADASGYLSLAALFLRGHLTHHEPLAAIADWPRAAESIAPLGWWVTADASVQVPTYALGLPLLMLPLHAVGGTLAASLLGPAALGVTVWAVARLAGAIAGGAAALLAALWIATSPAALWAAVQPMSDLPAAAAWLVCWVELAVPRRKDQADGVTLRRALAGGVAAGLAVLIRPNLAPLALLPLAYVALYGAPRFAVATRRPAQHVTTAAGFLIPVALGAAIVAAAQWTWYGSPWRSGYGTAGELYALSNAPTNARLYTEWLYDVHGPWLLAAPLALLVVRGRLLRWLMACAALATSAYLIYAIFEVWTYLRFLLPAIALAAVAMATLVATLAQRLPSFMRAFAVLAALLAIGVSQVRSARAHEVFALRDQHLRALLAGHYLEARLPDRSVVIAGEQSGAVRYYTGLSILRWDVLTPELLATAISRTSAAGYDVWIALDEWEEGPFRAKFAGTGLGALDWPPAMDAGITLRTRAWRLRDRDTYLQAGMAHTDRLR